VIYVPEHVLALGLHELADPVLQSGEGHVFAFLQLDSDGLHRQIVPRLGLELLRAVLRVPVSVAVVVGTRRARCFLRVAVAVVMVQRACRLVVRLRRSVVVAVAVAVLGRRTTFVRVVVRVPYSILYDVHNSVRRRYPYALVLAGTTLKRSNSI